MGSGELTSEEIAEKRVRLRDLNARLQEDLDPKLADSLQKEAFVLLDELPKDEKEAAIEEAVEASLKLFV